MSLSQMQKSLIERARNVGNSEMAVPIDDAAGAYLLARVIVDLGLRAHYAELPEEVPPFYETAPVSSLALDGIDFEALAEKVFTTTPDADTYFSCLAALLKARLKFERILRRQPFPTMDQVGPRGLLQYGALSPPALAGLLYWRKWFYDTDNRAAQETGYVRAHSRGGHRRRSSERRAQSRAAGRRRHQGTAGGLHQGKSRLRVQDTPHDRGFRSRPLEPRAGLSRGLRELEIHPRLGRAGRHDEPQAGGARARVRERRKSLISKGTALCVEELVRAFENAGGKAHIGQAAWRMLENESGPTMSQFLSRYVRRPLDALIHHMPTRLPSLSAQDTGESVVLAIGDELLVVERDAATSPLRQRDTMPDDADDAFPGV